MCSCCTISLFYLKFVHLFARVAQVTKSGWANSHDLNMMNKIGSYVPFLIEIFISLVYMMTQII